MDPATPQDEAYLIAAARGGDREAWTRLCRAHAPRLAAYLGARLRRPAVVEKLVSDAIVVAWEKLPELAEDDEFPSWLRSLGAGLAMSWRSEHDGEAIKEPFPEQRCDGDAEALARMRRLDEAFGRLTKEQRMALEQRFRGGLDGALLDDVLHLAPGASAAAVERALESLDRELGP